MARFSRTEAPPLPATSAALFSASERIGLHHIPCRAEIWQCSAALAHDCLPRSAIPQALSGIADGNGFQHWRFLNETRSVS